MNRANDLNLDHICHTITHGNRTLYLASEFLIKGLKYAPDSANISNRTSKIPAEQKYYMKTTVADSLGRQTTRKRCYISAAAAISMIRRRESNFCHISREIYEYFGIEPSKSVIERRQKADAAAERQKKSMTDHFAQFTISEMEEGIDIEELDI